MAEPEDKIPQIILYGIESDRSKFAVWLTQVQMTRPINATVANIITQSIKKNFEGHELLEGATIKQSLIVQGGSP